MTRFALTIDYTRPDGVMARKWSDFAKAANGEVAGEWQRRYVPLHFQSFASGRYNYQRRRPATLKKKQAMASRGKLPGGSVIDLVMSGLLAQQMGREGILQVYPTRFTLVHPTHVPRIAKNSTIDLHAEAVKVHPSEDRYLGDVWRARILKELATYRPRAPKST